jgi:hypothetical protein
MKRFMLLRFLIIGLAVFGLITAHQEQARWYSNAFKGKPCCQLDVDFFVMD